MRAILTVVLGCVMCLCGCHRCGSSSLPSGPGPYFTSIGQVTGWLDVDGMDVAADVTVIIAVRGPLARAGASTCEDWDNRSRLRHRLMLILADEKPESFRGAEALDKLEKRIAEAFYAELGGPHSGWGINVLFERVMLYERGTLRPPPRRPGDIW